MNLIGQLLITSAVNPGAKLQNIIQDPLFFNKYQTGKQMFRDDFLLWLLHYRVQFRVSG
jgi:hypothetical protein